MKKQYTSIILFSLSVSLAAILISCGGDAQEETVKKSVNGEFFLTRTQLANIDVKMERPQYRALQTYLQFNGKIKSLPNFSATVSSNIDGKVEKVFVREGDFVKQGQPLLTLNSMHLIELQEQYLTAKSEEEFMAIEFNRQQELKRNNIGALSEYQIVEAKYKAAISKEKAIRAKLELLGINLNNLIDARNSNITSNLVIKSPISGYLHSFPITVGMLANPETILAQIIDNNQLHAEIYVYDKDIDLIKEGQKVQIDFVNHSFENVEGIVISIDRVIDIETKAITVHVIFQAPEKSLILPDMTIKATLERQKNNHPSHVVPVSALLVEEDQTYVFFSSNSLESDTIGIRKIKINIEDRNEKEAEIIFANTMPDIFYIASNNVSILEVERRKRITN